jgi:hypothetical protein
LSRSPRDFPHRRFALALAVLSSAPVPIYRFIFLLLAAGLFAGPGLSRGQEPITRIAEVRALPRDETAQARPVRLRAVVTWSGRNSFNFQDDSAGGYVNVQLARKRGLWQGDDAALASVRPGAVVEVEGVTDRGGGRAAHFAAQPARRGRAAAAACAARRAGALP